MFINKKQITSMTGVVTQPTGESCAGKKISATHRMALGHPMGTEQGEWSGENNECEYTYDLISKQKKKLQGHVTHPRQWKPGIARSPLAALGLHPKAARLTPKQEEEQFLVKNSLVKP